MKILLVQTGFLGDLVLSTPVIANIKALYPKAELTVLTTPLAADLVRSHPAVSQVLTFDKRKSQKGLAGLFDMQKRIRREKFAIVFSLHKSYRTALLLFLAGIPKRYGFKEAAASFIYSKTAKRSDQAHDVLRNLAIFRCIGKEPEELLQEMKIALPADAIAKAESLLATKNAKPLVGIAPGSVWATKRWTSEGFSVLAKALASQGFQVVLIGGPDDAEIASEVESSAALPLVNLIGKTSLIESAAVIAKLDLLVCNDSAPLHLASASKTPVVAIFCATVPEFGYGPWGTEAEVLGVSGLSCRPCGRHGGNICPTGTKACQIQLLPETVIAATNRLYERVRRIASAC